jgi:two-component system chemotaxis response regulator CheY
MRALVIDDARTMRLILKHVLTGIGFAVTEAGDGRAGLEQLARLGRPDVVFVDCFMPEMDGFAFLRAVRADARYAGLPVLMASAGEADEQAQARAAGADDFLVKPFSRESVLATLERLGVAVGAAP